VERLGGARRPDLLRGRPEGKRRSGLHAPEEEMVTPSAEEGLIFNDFAGRGAMGGEFNIRYWAGCRTLLPANLAVPTIFFEELDEAEVWLLRERGPEGRGWKRCGTCGAFRG
jgi:hypothetical protein